MQTSSTSISAHDLSLLGKEEHQRLTDLGGAQGLSLALQLQTTHGIQEDEFLARQTLYKTYT